MDDDYTISLPLVTRDSAGARARAALAALTGAVVATRGHPSREVGRAFVAAAYTERQMLDTVRSVAVKTRSNDSSHLFHTAIDPGFARRGWDAPADAGRCPRPSTRRKPRPWIAP